MAEEVDLSSPSPAGALEVGLISQHEYDLVQAIMDRPLVQHGAGAHTTWHRDVRGAEETAAYDKYRDSLDDWDGHVETYQDDNMHVTDEDYDDGVTHDQPKPGSQDPDDIEGVDDPPAVPDEDTVPPQDRSVLTVNTEALKRFAYNLSFLQTSIDTSLGYVNEVDVKAGNFGAGFALANSVNGGTGLRTDTSNFMRSVRDTIQDIRDDIAVLVVDYDNAEELNGITGDKLGKVFSESFGDIGGLSNYGNSTSEGVIDSNGNDDGNNGNNA
jgi:hypothetical protein